MTTTIVSDRRTQDAVRRGEIQRWAPIVAAGLVQCQRCGKRIEAIEPWDLSLPGDLRFCRPEHADRCDTKRVEGEVPR